MPDGRQVGRRVWVTTMLEGSDHPGVRTPFWIGGERWRLGLDHGMTFRGASARDGSADFHWGHGCLPSCRGMGWKREIGAGVATQRASDRVGT